jgi:hypothetical protein
LRAKRSNPSRAGKKEWIASSRSLSSGAHSRDPLAPRNDDRYFFGLMARYGPLNATPSSIGCSAPVLQRQPLSVF